MARFLNEHEKTSVVEDGKVIFDLPGAQYTLATEHDRCTLHLWNAQRNLVRTVVACVERSGTLRLATERFGHTQTKLLELRSSGSLRDRRSTTARNTQRDAARAAYVEDLERILLRHFDAWKPDGFRTSMDLERSFGPAYARGMLVQGNKAFAVIGAGEQESTTTIDGILTAGILWLHTCREQGGGRRLFEGLKVILPRGTSALTLARMAWMNTAAATWELYELEQGTGDLTERDPADQGNLRTQLVHHPDERASEERFADAIAQVKELVPPTERHRIERRLRSTAEMVFLLHGLQFASAEIVFAPNSFAQRIEITAGVGPQATLLTPDTRADIEDRIAELFDRRRAVPGTRLFVRQGASPSRRIGAPMTAPAHARMRARGAAGPVSNDPLYRASPERWLESMLRSDLAPLTRSLGPSPADKMLRDAPAANPIGDRADPIEMDEVDGNTVHAHDSIAARFDRARQGQESPRLIPRLDPQHVYAQVPAIAGASDRGLLDLLGITADGRLAVIEIKADEDMHFALQGLDYWIRVRQHHLATPDPATGLGEFQRHGYFAGVDLSPLPPRLYLVAPALHIHPATETVLKYVSPKVEWQLLAVDERWRSQVRVVWRRSGGHS
jgi:hypothetical protein